MLTKFSKFCNSASVASTCLTGTGPGHRQKTKLGAWSKTKLGASSKTKLARATWNSNNTNGSPRKPRPGARLPAPRGRSRQARLRAGRVRSRVGCRVGTPPSGRSARCELGVGGEGAWLSRRAAAGSAGMQEDRAEGSGEGVTRWLWNAAAAMLSDVARLHLSSPLAPSAGVPAFTHAACPRVIC